MNEIVVNAAVFCLKGKVCWYAINAEDICITKNVYNSIMDWIYCIEKDMMDSHTNEEISVRTCTQVFQLTN